MEIALTVHFIEVGVAFTHLFDYHPTEVSICDVVVALFVHFLAHLYTFKKVNSI